MKVSADHRLTIWLRSLISFFRDAPAPASEAARLDADDKIAFARSLLTLSWNERGWISFGEFALLFSSEDVPFSPGFNDSGATIAGAEFAATCQCSMQVDDLEMRVYFTRVACNQVS